MPWSAIRRAPHDRADLPWRKPQREWLLLALVAAAALTPIYAVSSQDVSRLCLTRALISGRVQIGSCAGDNFDRASFGGHTFSDKAPGQSVIAIPAVAATNLPSASQWRTDLDARIWVIRLLTGGVAFAILIAMFGRVAEGLAPGRGGLTLVMLALGTLVGALAATTFGHVTAATLGFGAFLAAWRRRWLLAGLLAGCGVLVAYEAAIVAVILAVYALAHGRRPVASYLAAALPAAAALAAYNVAAFGSPLHLSYRYVSNRFARDQASGLFGIGLPRWHSTAQVVFADRGLFVTSPVLLAGCAGLALLWRRHRAEALVCASVTVAFLLLEFGYFLPYGGTSPGPRFLIPALPFLALGIGPAMMRWPRAVTLLAAPSLVASLTLMLTWSKAVTNDQRQTVWAELARALGGNTQHLRSELANNVLTFAGVSRVAAAVVVATLATAAFATARISESARRSAVEQRDE